MIEYARIKAGQVIDHRAFAAADEVPVLASSKGKWVPVVTEDPPFDERTQVRGDQVRTIEADRVVLSSPVRAKSADEVAAMRLAKIDDIKSEASRRILNLFPAWKQTNMLARGVELNNRRADARLTLDEEAEVVALQSAWDRVKAIRSTSDAIEATVPNDALGISAVDVTLGWD